MNAATSPRRRARRPRTAGILAGLAALTLGLSACGGGGDDSSSAASGTPGADDPIRIGVVGASDDQWKIFQKKAEEAGFDVEIVDFTEYTQPNPALSQGQLDLNQFQHILYLAQYNVEAGDDLVPVGATAIYPLGLYSKKYQSVDEIPNGSEIAIPNDPTNLARALLVLQDAGLVTLKDGGSAFSTEADVVARDPVVGRPFEPRIPDRAYWSLSGARSAPPYVVEHRRETSRVRRREPRPTRSR